MAKIVKLNKTSEEIENTEDGQLSVYFDTDPGLDSGDRVTLRASDGAEFIAEVYDVEETRGQVHFELV